jgi:hypothetical protein
MRTFSVATAFASGVDLIERKGRTVLGWGILLFVIQLAPRLLQWAMNGGDPSVALGPIASSSAGSAGFMQGVQGGVQAHGPGGVAALALWGLLGSSVLYCAIYRAVLEPRDSGFAYVRFGKAELAQILLMLCQYILFWVFGVLVVIAFIVLMAAGGFLAQPWMAVVQGVGFLALVGATLWILLRFSLAGPMTFAHRSFRFFDSWKLTRRHSWKLFWTTFLLFALVIGLSLVSMVGLFVPLGFVLGLTKLTLHGLGMAAAEASGWPVVVGLAVLFVISLLNGALYAIFLAPWARIYADLTDGSAG